MVPAGSKSVVAGLMVMALYSLLVVILYTQAPMIYFLYAIFHQNIKMKQKKKPFST